MPFQRTRPSPELDSKTRAYLESLVSSRTASVAEVRRAQMVLLAADGVGVSEIARRVNVSRPAVDRCLSKVVQLGPREGLKDLPRSGRPGTITDEAKAWLVSVACLKPKDIGYSFELWTLDLLSKHVIAHCEAAGHPCLKRAGRGTIQRLLSAEELKPHRISYYLERRDPDFDVKMAQVLLIYQQVALAQARGQDPKELVAYLSYDEKPGIQAIENLAPDLPPVPGEHPCVSRDHQYRRHGTVTLMAGIDLLTGRVHAMAQDRHRSREFVAFLSMLDRAYPADFKLRVVLDNHSAHVSKETRAYLDTKPNRFEFIFTPTHGSWLNLIEMFFAKMTRTMLRGIRVASKQELKDRLLQFIREVNQAPVPFRWHYGIEPVVPDGAEVA